MKHSDDSRQQSKGLTKSASTFVSEEVDAAIEAVVAKDSRTRAYVIREILTEWSAKQPAPRKRAA